MAQASMGKFFAKLAQGKPVPAIVLLGSDSYLREMCRKRIVQAYVPDGMKDWALAKISLRETDWDEVLQRAQTMPMMAACQVIVVDHVESFEKLGEKSREAILAMLSEYLDSPAPFTVLVLEAIALDGRQKLFKLLSEKALLVELSIGSESAAVLAVQMAKELGVEIDQDAAAHLADILNGEPARIRVEIEKLAMFTLERGKIALADVDALVVAGRKNTVWQLADMLANRRRDAALAFLDNLMREGEQPAGIVGALAWTYRKLIEARDLPANTNGFQAVRQLGMRSDAAEAAVRNAHRVSKKQLVAGLVALAEADSQLKSANPSPRAFMEFLVARLTAPV